jgi:hypothetical protein
MCCFAYAKITLNPPVSLSHREDLSSLNCEMKVLKDVSFVIFTTAIK